MGDLPAEQVVLEVAAARGEVEQVLRVADGPVEVAHDGAPDISTRLCEHVEYLARCGRIAAGVYEDCGTGLLLGRGGGAQHFALVLRQGP